MKKLITLYTYINSNIGKKVYINHIGDIAMDSRFKSLVLNKTPVELVKLTKGGLALIRINNTEYTIPPRNISLFDEEQ